MLEDTTTTTDADSVQADESSQLETSDTQAVQAEDTNSNEEVSEADTTDQTDSSDDELLAWAEKKGIKTDDPKVLLKMVRESEIKMHEATTQANALKSTVNTIGEESGIDETSQLLNRLNVTEFYLNNPGAKSLDEQMAKIVEAKPFLADDLETVYELAKARTQTNNELQAKQLGQKEALAQVAKAEKAAPPNASATTRQGTPGEPNDEEIGRMSASEYREYKASKGGNVWQ